MVVVVIGLGTTHLREGGVRLVGCVCVGGGRTQGVVSHTPGGEAGGGGLEWKNRHPCVCRQDTERQGMEAVAPPSPSPPLLLSPSPHSPSCCPPTAAAPCNFYRLAVREQQCLDLGEKGRKDARSILLVGRMSSRKKQLWPFFLTVVAATVSGFVLWSYALAPCLQFQQQTIVSQASSCLRLLRTSHR